MSSKLNLLTYLDGKIYSPYLKKIQKYTVEAQRLNKGIPFHYKCFNSPETAGHFNPNRVSREYMDSLLVELAPIINERAIVNAYLLKFMNQIPEGQYSAVFSLLPEEFEEVVRNIVKNAFASGVSEVLLNKFKAMPEYLLIKKRLFLKDMINE